MIFFHIDLVPNLFLHLHYSEKLYFACKLWTKKCWKYAVRNFLGAQSYAILRTLPPSFLSPHSQPPPPPAVWPGPSRDLVNTCEKKKTTAHAWFRHLLRKHDIDHTNRLYFKQMFRNKNYNFPHCRCFCLTTSICSLLIFFSKIVVKEKCTKLNVFDTCENRVNV